MRNSRIGFILSALSVAVSLVVVFAWVVAGGDSFLTLTIAIVVAAGGVISCANHAWRASRDKTP